MDNMTIESSTFSMDIKGVHPVLVGLFHIKCTMTETLAALQLFGKGKYHTPQRCQ
jgi:hypothetical protein